MTQFRFRLQKVLDLREERERVLASQLARAVGAEQDALAVLEQLRQARIDGAAAATPTPTSMARSIGELSNIAFLLAQMDGYIENAADAAREANTVVTAAKGELTLALQDRRILDRLRERHADDHRASLEQNDRKTMDDIALSRYTGNESQ